MVNDGYLVQGRIGGKGDADAGAAGFFVPEIAALPHAGADVGEGADGGEVGGHVYNMSRLFNFIFFGYVMPSAKNLNIFCYEG